MAPPQPPPPVISINCKLPEPSVARTCPIVPSSMSNSVIPIVFGLIVAALEVPDKSPPSTGSCTGIFWKLIVPAPFVVRNWPFVPSPIPNCNIEVGIVGLFCKSL